MSNAELTDKIKDLENQVLKLHEAFDGVTKMLNKPNRRLTTDSCLDEAEILPIKTVDEMDNFDRLLVVDKDFRKRLVDIFVCRQFP